MIHWYQEDLLQMQWKTNAKSILHSMKTKSVFDKYANMSG